MRRESYSKEFKLEAIRLLNEDNQPASEIALQLGVKRTLLYRWQDQLREKGEADQQIIIQVKSQS